MDQSDKSVQKYIAESADQTGSNTPPLPDTPDVAPTSNVAVPVSATMQPPPHPVSTTHQEDQTQVQHVEDARERRRQFWANQMKEITEADPKNHSLPLAPIKRIMKADNDVRLISKETTALFAKACELFIMDLTSKAWVNTEEDKRRTVQKRDITETIYKTDTFDFLEQVIPRDELMKKQILKATNAGQQASSSTDPRTHGCSVPQQHEIGASSARSAGGDQPPPFMPWYQQGPQIQPSFMHVPQAVSQQKQELQFMPEPQMQQSYAPVPLAQSQQLSFIPVPQSQSHQNQQQIFPPSQQNQLPFQPWPQAQFQQVPFMRWSQAQSEQNQQLLFMPQPQSHLLPFMPLSQSEENQQLPFMLWPQAQSHQLPFKPWPHAQSQQNQQFPFTPWPQAQSEQNQQWPFMPQAQYPQLPFTPWPLSQQQLDQQTLEQFPTSSFMAEQSAEQPSPQAEQHTDEQPDQQTLVQFPTSRFMAEQTPDEQSAEQQSPQAEQQPDVQPDQQTLKQFPTSSFMAEQTPNEQSAEQPSPQAEQQPDQQQTPEN